MVCIYILELIGMWGVLAGRRYKDLYFMILYVVLLVYLCVLYC